MDVTPAVPLRAVEHGGRILLEDGSGEWRRDHWVALPDRPAPPVEGDHIVVVTVRTAAGARLLDVTRARMWDGTAWVPAPGATCDAAPRVTRRSSMWAAMNRRRALSWKGLDKEYAPSSTTQVARRESDRGGDP